MNKTKNKNSFQEGYQVTLDYQKEDGYWVCSHKELVWVEVQNGVREKKNHDRAAEIAKTLYPNCRISSVTYL